MRQGPPQLSLCSQLLSSAIALGSQNVLICLSPLEILFGSLSMALAFMFATGSLFQNIVPSSGYDYLPRLIFLHWLPALYSYEEFFLAIGVTHIYLNSLVLWLSFCSYVCLIFLLALTQFVPFSCFINWDHLHLVIVPFSFCLMLSCKTGMAKCGHVGSQQPWKEGAL